MGRTSGSTSAPFHYKLGPLFPGRAAFDQNVVLSSSLHYNRNSETIRSKSSSKQNQGELQTSLAISTKPIAVDRIDRFLDDYLIPGLTDKTSTDSLFNNYLAAVSQGYIGRPRNLSISNARLIGYIGPDADQGDNNSEYWSSTGQSNDPLMQELSNPDNYKPKTFWGSYDGGTTVSSDFNKTALNPNIKALLRGEDLPKAWRPAYLYTYGLLNEQGQLNQTGYPGPTLFMEPGDTLKASFRNEIKIPGYSKKRNQISTYIPSDSAGDNGGVGMGGTATTNLHMHGAHVNPGGFGDNVVARYTSGQTWTSTMSFPEDTGKGSYWYHPHYHPSVNEQLYGGLSGFTQIGDPLSLVPGMQDVPRNLVLIKTLNLQPAQNSGGLKLTTYDNFLGQQGAPAKSAPLANNMTVNTVNGAYQPTGKSDSGGWQAFTLTNQTNVTQHNIAFTQINESGEEIRLPLFIYGEDGHQLPQIHRVSSGALATTNPNQEVVDQKYTQLNDVVSLPPGKRVDVLVYLPQGVTNITSLYGVNSTGPQVGTTGNASLAAPKGGSANLTATAQQRHQSAGPLARVKVKNAVPELSSEAQDQSINAINSGIQTQEILPTTTQSEYNPNAIPSVNLFAESSEGDPLWSPLRKRSFSFANFALVGPKEERDAATQEALASYEASTGKNYERYELLPVGQPGMETWLGYEDGPFLINDHVFPNGNLTIAQLGTMEEWQLRNWSQASPSYYIPHPFHIHLNDYQTLNSDTELANKRNLEDTTILNSSGYRFFNTATGTIEERRPIKGDFHSIEPALDPAYGYTPNGSNQLGTWGAVDQTVRMLFQDYLGTYVFHCHILAHEDAGMMQAVMVVENTDSSWLAPQQDITVESTENNETTFEVRLAQTYTPFSVSLKLQKESTLSRLTSGDLSQDYVQDLLVSSSGDGKVRIVDGGTLLSTGQTEIKASLRPYASNLSPWAFAEDFSGDGQRDLVTGGFAEGSTSHRLRLRDFTITAWKPDQDGSQYSEEFQFKPYADIPAKKGQYKPLDQLSEDQFSFVTGDFNLDNFNDYAMAYAIQGGGFRVTILDGAAISLLYQTKRFEGGYFPNKSILADAVVKDDSLKNLNSLTLSSGFNSYAQNAIENLLVSTESKGGQQLSTLNLDAGHFITTSLPSGNSRHQHGQHHSSSSSDERIKNLDPTLLPLNLSSINQWTTGQGQTLTAAFNGAFANGSLLAGDQLFIAQGNSANGIASTSNVLNNNAQQLVVDLAVLDDVDGDEITGVTTGNLNSTYSADQVVERNNLSAVVMAAYGGLIGQPGTLSRWSGGNLGQGLSASELVDSLLSETSWQALTSEHFGGALDTLNVDTITGITFQTLYGREASAGELRQWAASVNAGLDKDLLPLAIAQNTAGPDQFRLSYLSAACQWLAAQFGSQAVQDGSFGQGFQADLARFRDLSDQAFAASAMSSWDQANQAYQAFQQHSLSELLGSPVSKSGFF